MRRRDLVVAAAGAAVFARPAAAAAQAAREADALTRALRHEHAGVFAYDAALRGDLLSGAERRIAQRIRGHEARHAEAIATALGDLGWVLPDPPARVEDLEVPALRVAVDGLRDRSDALTLLGLVEQLAGEVHRAAIGRLRDPRHIQLAATILAAEASHLVVWRPVR